MLRRFQVLKTVLDNNQENFWLLPSKNPIFKNMSMPKFGLYSWTWIKSFGKVSSYLALVELEALSNKLECGLMGSS